MRYEPLFRGPNNLTIEDVAKKDQSEQNEQSLTRDSNTLYIQEPSSDLKMFGKRRTYSFFLYFLLVIFTVIIEAVVSCVCNTRSYPRDCQDVKDNGHLTSGVYRVYPACAYIGLNVYCDMDTDGGGWLVFQQRMVGTEDFDRSWDDYLKGFGDVSGDHWLGNQWLHRITGQASYELRVELSDWEGTTSNALYEIFRVENLKKKYTLVVGIYSGDTGDSLGNHNGMQFTTWDSDNDNWDSGNCARDKAFGGWWYNKCYQSNLNGIYHQSNDTDGKKTGIFWKEWKGDFYSLKRTEMKIRRI